MNQKRVAAIHDISCFGKCSLTVALPIISAAGVECSVIPTAVLSTHTGGFTGFTYRDLTEDITGIADHWETLPISFDAIYTGFLGSFEQIELMMQIFDRFKKENTTILVDPVMADNGKLYAIFPDTFPEGMKKLCTKADIVVPNITEASLMLGIEYKEPPHTKEYIENILIKLTGLGPKKAVLTGVSFDNETLGAATYDSEAKEFGYTFENKIEGYYHGTGDVFGSALLGALMNDFDLLPAAEVAVKFTVSSIKKTAEAKTDIRFGVNFEQSFPEYLRLLGKVEVRR